MAAFDAFLKIDGIDGESFAKGHEKWIELYSFSWGVSQAGGGGTAAAGKSSPQPFSFMKTTDSASPQLFLSCCKGKHFDKVSLNCRKAGGDNASADYMKIDFFDVFFTSYTEGGDTTTGQLPMESLSLNFVKIDFAVAPMSTDGQLGEHVRAGFDFKSNKGG